MILTHPIAIPTPAKVEIAEPILTCLTIQTYRSLTDNFPTLPSSIGSFRFTPKIRSLLNVTDSLDYIDYTKMASQVKPNTKPTPYADRPLPPSADLETPDDYKNTFKVRVPLDAHTGLSA
jgi:hypothetical protein